MERWMKVKQDFVTNSSSCSFIISENITTRDLAKLMVDIIFEDWRLFYKSYDQKFLKSIYSLLEKLEPNENILIPFSTNYETFISKTKNGDIFVDTSNNHDWRNNLNIEYRYCGPEARDTKKEYNKEFKYQSKLIFINIEDESKGTPKQLRDQCMKKLMDSFKNENKK
jgi:hypothetical protein